MVKSIPLKSIAIKIYTTQSHATVPHCTEGKNLNQAFCTLVQPTVTSLYKLSKTASLEWLIYCVYPTYTAIIKLNFPLFHSFSLNPTFKIQHHFYFLHRAFSYYLFPKMLIYPLLPRALLWHPFNQ